MTTLQKIGDAEFQSQVIDSTAPVVVDFFATWCGPCRILDPILKDLSASYADKVKFVKVDIDEAQGIAEKYGVTNVPTLIIFKEGKEADRRIGASPRPVLEGWIKDAAG